jgi:hypothetical protein
MPKKIQYLALLALLLPPALLSAVQPQYSQAKLIQVERKTREKINMYLVNTPVSTEVPYYQITVRLDNIDYKAEYTPRHPEEQLPEPWVEGADVMVRVERHHLVLKRPDGSELQWILLKRTPAKN